MPKNVKLVNLIYFITLSVLACIFLYWHFVIGLTRYFDVDEFAYLFWGYNFSIGLKPYTDFFFLLPPLFLFPISWIFQMFGRNVTALIMARALVFLFFLLSALLLYLIAKRTRNHKTALLSVVLFAFLPIPFDKMIEIRPDLLANALSLLGMYLFLLGEGRKKKFFFLSGLSYALSLGIMPKTFMYLIPVMVLAIYNLFNSKNIKELFTYFRFFLAPFFLGALIPVLIILTSAIQSSDLGLAIYSMTKMSSNVSKVLGAKFYMFPTHFFYPNDTYYGEPGYSMSYVGNLIIYVFASIWAVFSFISFLSHKSRDKCLGEFIIGSSFFLNLLAFVKIFPLKHAQYLIPLAPFIAYYFADFIFALWRNIEKILFNIVRNEGRGHLRISIKSAYFLLLFIFLGTAGYRMNTRKMAWNNTYTLEKVKMILRAVPKNASIFDLTGESTFFKCGYYLCALPYGQFDEALGIHIPDIANEFKKRDTKFVHVGSASRLYTIPPMQASYIQDNFRTFMEDSSLLIAK
ncbi:hypothetical protein COV53_03455 [Candidatus Gottesmanbacteria bacterium CG11_big_fil_rev_8_21_14_0_20_37_11]|uniref:Glycosyltransferase RgtA/B/C/D-like domain-containing protein n=3 Tax=Candidatus Gottesmaniibacteriota TaxID=1752720 RepID=A0A2M7RPF6_9BACT|nr:MAG: hypothetical protein AUJ73_01755 [Candidatus Gottesmanbacteria bacterium CG1_02_37_22]PIP33038.1 MAG: hypothetical protein COX23_01495 [Candidatus Gottesmanbacteria bacterium CG23_combo_of_CG06-09_8_20_14_all_37_19]PIR08355.1 MAG: hypothetical protein COV53_03455 [Candidatus Gottesmanbacteria bacterium CG11_big_fil_rev_8_21_14_0_20_37_11]PIZ02206.1 MAG: hypothetical protein COY59_06055 [Candidatus Gottesmanbacteria bacterium CG_4_10_14_0_8_um_filter_37_24]